MTSFNTIPQAQITSEGIQYLPNAGQLEARVVQNTPPHIFGGEAVRCNLCGLLQTHYLHREAWL